MSRKRALLFLLLAGAAVLAGLYVWGPTSAPAGQEPLVTLTGRSFGDFQRAFEAKSDQERLVLLLSPT